VTEHVKSSLEDGVLILTINRPEKKNALSRAMYLTLADAVEQAQDDPAVRVILLRGEGGVFTAGNDLADFAAVNVGDAEGGRGGSAYIEALGRAEKPIVAAVTGLAIGIGVTMLLHCDLVYVADDAKLSTPFVNLALVPEAASSALLPARIGHARAFAMFALGETVLGERAAEIGLANEALPAAEVEAKALEAARALARRPLGALIATKKLMRQNHPIMERMAQEGELFSQRLKTAEAAEAFAAFAERRAPDFTKAG
jgi:enoyl-CoA hydratase/carnithine racemase